MQTVAETKPTSTTIPRRWITLKINQQHQHQAGDRGKSTKKSTTPRETKKKKHLLEKQKEPRTNQQTPSQRINKSRRLNHQSKNTKSPRDISNNSKACKQFLFIGKPKENSNKRRDINKTPINKHRKKSNTMYLSTP